MTLLGFACPLLIDFETGSGLAGLQFPVLVCPNFPQDFLRWPDTFWPDSINYR
jgi:hypothetical protein